MGAALTYARRYALFTLVGIAGEDDLDAPDLPNETVERTVSAVSDPRGVKAMNKRAADRSDLVSQNVEKGARRRLQPCETHHLRFAQLRALGRKVSDEFTVPLCRVHHRELHRFKLPPRKYKQRENLAKFGNLIRDGL